MGNQRDSHFNLNAEESNAEADLLIYSAILWINRKVNYARSGRQGIFDLTEEM